MGEGYSCLKQSCRAQVIDRVMSHSDLRQVKIRELDQVNVHHCEICDAIAHFQVVPINFAQEG